MTQDTQDPTGLPSGKGMSSDEYAAFNQFLAHRGRVPTNGELAAAVTARAGKMVAQTLMGGRVVDQAPAIQPTAADEPAPVPGAIDPDSFVNAKGLSGPELGAVSEFLRKYQRLPTNAELAGAIKDGKTRHLGHSVGNSVRRGVM